MLSRLVSNTSGFIRFGSGIRSKAVASEGFTNTCSSEAILQMKCMSVYWLICGEHTRVAVWWYKLTIDHDHFDGSTTAYVTYPYYVRTQYCSMNAFNAWTPPSAKSKKHRSIWDLVLPLSRVGRLLFWCRITWSNCSYLIGSGVHKPGPSSSHTTYRCSKYQSGKYVL